MTALSFSPWTTLFFTHTPAPPRPSEADPAEADKAREAVVEMIGAGACDSENGARILMAMSPGSF